ncbi:MAG: reverse transcriptase family protein, partial [Pseudomonadota bacterium]
MTLLHKKGDKSDPSNYRPISLLSHTYKIFMKIMQRRLDKILDANQPRDQAGFRKGFSTMDHIQVMNQLMEKTREYNLPLYVAFVDYEKAFDSVKHKDLFAALHNQGIRGKIYRLLELIYSKAKARIKLETLGRKFSVKRGVRQGDPLSPKLFSAVLEEVFRNCDWPDSVGLPIDGEILHCLRFADDLVLFSPNSEGLNKKIDELKHKGEEVGLKINFAKTKVMTNNIVTPITSDGHDLEYVNEFVYLGQLVSFENRQDKEIGRRLQNAWKAFWKLRKYLTTKNIEMQHRRRLFDMCILPVMTYGSPTWSLTKRQQERLNVTQRAMERRMLGITRKDKVRNEEIRRRTKVKDVVTEARNLKWSWAGHSFRPSVIVSSCQMTG